MSPSPPHLPLPLAHLPYAICNLERSDRFRYQLQLHSLSSLRLHTHINPSPQIFAVGMGDVVTSADGVVLFPATITPPSSTNTLLLLGNGITDMTIESIHVKFTEIAIYMDSAIHSYIGQYKGRPAHKLLDDATFFKNLIEAPVEKFIKVVIIKGIKGGQYGSTLESSIRDKLAYDDKYEEDEEIALEGLTAYFRTLNLETKSSVLYRWPAESMKLEVTYSSDGLIPPKASYVVDNTHVALAILSWFVGERTISLSTISSIAENISVMV